MKPTKVIGTFLIWFFLEKGADADEKGVEIEFDGDDAFFWQKIIVLYVKKAKRKRKKNWRELRKKLMNESEDMK